MHQKNSSYENKQEHITSLNTPLIETWIFQFPESQSTITITMPEFTCVCPKTNLPDFATIQLDYIPNNDCLELKSLKEYLLFFREIGIFHEHFVNILLNDTVKACKPKSMVVTGQFNARGGISTTAKATYQPTQE